MASDATPPEPNIGVLLFIPYRAMENRVLERMRAAGYEDFTTAQARLMQRIGPNGSRLTELAEQAQITKQTAGFLVDALERARYVDRVPDPTDGRARLVRLAERGTAAATLANTAVAEIEAEWAKHLGKQRTSQLRRALTDLREITDPYM